MACAPPRLSSNEGTSIPRCHRIATSRPSKASAEDTFSGLVQRLIRTLTFRIDFPFAVVLFRLSELPVSLATPPIRHPPLSQSTKLTGQWDSSYNLLALPSRTVDRVKQVISITAPWEKPSASAMTKLSRSFASKSTLCFKVSRAPPKALTTKELTFCRHYIP